MEVDKEQESAAAGPEDDVADVPEAHAHPSDDASAPPRPTTAGELARIVQALGPVMLRKRAMRRQGQLRVGRRKGGRRERQDTAP